jgi:hypothetical protein
MYSVREVFSDNITDLDIYQIIQFCDENGNQNPNYRYQHFTLDQPTNNWFDVMFKEKRFSKDNGGLCLLLHNNDLVGISGYNRSTFSPDIWISGARTLIHKEHRHNILISKHIVPFQIDAIKQRGGKCVVWLFDASNKRNIFNIAKKGKLNALLQDKLAEFRESYENLQLLDYPIVINHTMQNVIYEYLDPAYTFDWDIIECTM